MWCDRRFILFILFSWHIVSTLKSFVGGLAWFCESVLVDNQQHNLPLLGLGQQMILGLLLEITQKILFWEIVSFIELLFSLYGCLQTWLSAGLSPFTYIRHALQHYPTLSHVVWPACASTPEEAEPTLFSSLFSLGLSRLWVWGTLRGLVWIGHLLYWWCTEGFPLISHRCVGEQ